MQFFAFRSELDFIAFPAQGLVDEVSFRRTPFQEFYTFVGLAFQLRDRGLRFGDDLAVVVVGLG